MFLLSVFTLGEYCFCTMYVAALGDECQALPVRPVIVGYDHEWLSVSPLAISSWVSYPGGKISHRESYSTTHRQQQVLVFCSS